MEEKKQRSGVRSADGAQFTVASGLSNLFIHSLIQKTFVGQPRRQCTAQDQSHSCGGVARGWERAPGASGEGVPAEEVALGVSEGRPCLQRGAHGFSFLV